MMKKKKTSHTCCEKCRNYWTCETKWYRGETGAENICCVLCAHYDACWAPANKKTSSKKTK